MNQSNLTGREQRTLGNKLTRHARNNCANFIGQGECPLYEMCIVQTYSTSKTHYPCDYFEKGVLPTDPILHAEYNKAYKNQSTANQRSCKQCEESYIATGNAQKYCTDCAADRRRERNRLQMKERRLDKSLENYRNS